MHAAMGRVTLRIIAVVVFLINASNGDGGNNRDDMFIYSSVDIYDDDDLHMYNATSNLTYYERWQADDPYFPDDDSIRRQFYAEMEQSEANSTSNVDIIERANFFLTSIDPLAVASVACYSLVGIITYIFCMTLTMYFLKVYWLMRQYHTNGTSVEAKILSSEPNMNGCIEKEDEEDKRGLVQIDGTNGSDDHSYHEMADDETTVTSYRQIDTGSDESENSDETHTVKEQIMPTPRHSNKDDHDKEQNHGGTKSKSKSGFATIQGYQKQQHTKSKQKLVVAEKFQIRRNQVPNEYIRSSQKFHSVIEYANIAASDGYKIRKQLSLMGEDVIIDDPINTSKQFRIKLYVLPDYPMSGLPCGEVHRSRRCHRLILFLLFLSLGVTVIASCAYAIYFNSHSAVFVVYMVALVIQVPLLSCFLGRSFDKVLSSSYLEKGLNVSPEDAEKGYNEKLDSISFA